MRPVSNAFETGRIPQAWILTGVRGVGKTTTARILARALNYELPDGSVKGPTIRMPTLGVHSEIGQLRQAIIHRPGLELSRLTPANVGDLLFDDILWAKRAREEHDAFAETLREKGVTVHYFAQLLAETLEIPDGRAYILDRLCTPEVVGPTSVDLLRRLADDIDSTTLASYLIEIGRAHV